jgi:hypothetical protein
LHTVVVALIGRNLVQDDRFVDWLESAWRRIDADTEPVHALLIVPEDDAIASSLEGRSEVLDYDQLLDPGRLGEEALRGAMVAIFALDLARQCLATTLGRNARESFLRLFISHAKGDGLPLAQSLNALVKSNKLKTFYDIDDLHPGTNWRETLHKAVSTSILIALRTNVYQTRYWCRQEVKWADEYGVPMVVVESRVGVMHPADGLPLMDGPGVSVPDGNLLRVLYVALREGLRVQLFLRTVEELRADGHIDHSAIVLPRRPSERAVLRACRQLAQKSRCGSRVIIYPDPPLGDSSIEIADAIIDKFVPGTRLTTPESVLSGALT